MNPKNYRVPSEEEIREARRRALEGPPMSSPITFRTVLDYCLRLIRDSATRVGRRCRK
jgi:hypothetical protein